jgi:putative metal-binding protein
MRTLASILAGSITLGVGTFALTYCAEPDMTLPDSGPALPACEDAGGKPGKNCACDPKKYMPTPCYSGPAGTPGNGSCKSGIRSCDPNTKILSGCEGEVLPKEETCNLADDDCNGKVDDVPSVKNAPAIGWCTSPACEDAGDAAITCFTASAQGICGAGSLQCGPGGTLVCQPFVAKGTDEVCNGVDDDCNGMVDDNIPDLGPCELDGGIGECAHGKVLCANGIQSCIGAMPDTEKCDGLDNNCNAKIDEKTCTQGMAVYCCQDNANKWGCTATPNDGYHKNCRVGL